MTAKAAKARKRNRYEIDDEALVKHWELASSLDEVCAQLGLPKHVIQRRVTQLRAMQVPLKDMRRAHVSANVERLTNIIMETRRS